MPLDRHRTVREALKHVADNPEWPDTVRGDMPVSEIVCRNLFDIANSPDTRVQGSVNKSLRAQRIIMDRLDGTRRTGTAPAVQKQDEVKFKDLTIPAVGSLPEPPKMPGAEDDDE